jgi:hypothetical protein
VISEFRDPGVTYWQWGPEIDGWRQLVSERVGVEPLTPILVGRPDAAGFADVRVVAIPEAGVLDPDLDIEDVLRRRETFIKYLRSVAKRVRTCAEQVELTPSLDWAPFDDEWEPPQGTGDRGGVIAVFEAAGRSEPDRREPSSPIFSIGPCRAARRDWASVGDGLYDPLEVGPVRCPHATTMG